jgi:signal transduction histidine kinase
VTNQIDKRAWQRQQQRLEADLLEALEPFLQTCLSLNHDLNNPLAGIIGFAEFLVDEGSNLNQMQRNYLRQILECAERIRRRVARLCEEKAVVVEDTRLREYFPWLGEPDL